MSSNKTSRVSTDNVIGAHIGCGGKVRYETTACAGWRYCEKCNASSLHGKMVEIVR